MFETPEHELTARAALNFAAAPAVFSGLCLIAATLFTGFDVTRDLAGAVVYVFLGGYPILLVFELLFVFKHYGDPVSRKLVVGIVTLFTGCAVWIVTIFLAFHLLPFRT